MYHYERDLGDDRWLLIDEDAPANNPDHGCIIASFERLGIMYMTTEHKTDKGAILIKHGPYDKVKERYDGRMQAYKKAGFEEEASSLFLVEATNASIEDVNFVLDHSCITPAHFQRLNVIEATAVEVLP